MQTRSCDVAPGADQDKYTLALQNEEGNWVGFDVELRNVIQNTLNAPAPLQAIEQRSYHKGRGSDRYIPDRNSFYDSLNGWRTTEGKFYATIQPEFATGLRDGDQNMPASSPTHFYGLYGDNRALAATFTASASYSASQILLQIRKAVPAGSVGTPGTLTIELCADSSGPSTVLKTVTIDSTDVEDVVSVTKVLDLPSLYSIVGTTVYWIKVYGGASDTKNACWEIGCDPNTAGQASTATDSGFAASTYSPYFRISVADVARKIVPFVFDECLYALPVNDDKSASTLYINGLRGRATSATSTTLVDTSHGSYAGSVIPVDQFIGWYIKIIRGTGAGQVRKITDNDGTSFTVATWDVTPDATSEYVVYGGNSFIGLFTFSYYVTKPILSQGFVYFPAGDSNAFVSMGIDYADADDHVFDGQTKSGVTSGCATLLASGYETGVGPVVWRSNNAAGTGSGGKGVVSRALVSGIAAYTNDLGFDLFVYAGDTTSTVNNMIFHGNKLYFMKSGAMFVVEGNRAVQIVMGAENRPDSKNGLAAVSAQDKNLYVNVGGEVHIIAGGSSYPTGLPTNLPVARSGYVSDMVTAEGWLFASIDAGDGTSSVMMWAIDQQSWSEHWRSFAAGRKIRAMAYHPCESTHPELWIDVAGDLVVQRFPRNGVRPINDTAVRFCPETVIEMAPVDLLTVDPKYYSKVYVTSKNLAQEGDTTGKGKIVVEYQSDNEVGSTTWHYAGEITTSPSGVVEVGVGGKRILGIRLRLISAEISSPVILEGYRMSLFSRTELYHQWQVNFLLYPDDEEQPSLKMLKWLRDAAKNSAPLTMKSTYHLFHNRRVTLSSEPYYRIADWEGDEEELEANMAFVLTEVA